jgi:hypothetical protein
MGLIEGPVGALGYASAQRPRRLAGHDVQINPGCHYPWMETGIIDYGAYRVIHATDGRTERRNDRCPPTCAVPRSRRQGLFRGNALNRSAIIG